MSYRVTVLDTTGRVSRGRAHEDIQAANRDLSFMVDAKSPKWLLLATDSLNENRHKYFKPNSIVSIDVVRYD